MKIKSQRDFVSGLLFLVVGVAFAWGATEYSFGNSARPGPGYFPFGLGVLLAILGAFVLFKALTLESEGGDPIGRIAWRPLLIIVAAVAVFGFALPRLGLVLTLPLLVLMSAMAGDEFHWRDVLITSVVLTLGSWALFIWGLKLTMPVWPVFING
ncbi:MAG: tripartite tricarboxylate transporter TctB family protein [Burkholderiales bacterium]|nr:MAG: tripartite tricarboxylate transporter TctB family protein [Burkholderiales bacterium]